MNPSTKFPNIYDITGLNSEIKGSLDYQPTAGNNRIFRIRDIIHITNIGLDPVNNYNESTAKNIDYFTMPNGVKLRIKLWVQYETIEQVAYQGVWYIRCLVDEHGNEYNKPVGPMPGAGSYRGVEGLKIYRKSYEAVNTYGIKFFLLNDYTTSGVAIDDYTELYTINFCFTLPIITTQAPASIRSFANIEAGRTYTIQKDGSTTALDDTWFFFPSVAEGSALNSSLGLETTYIIGNLDDFISLINQGGTDISPDDIFKPVNPEVPSQEEDPSGPGGGDGNYDDTSDPIDFPDLPTGGALSSGAIKAFQVTPAIMQAVFNKLWDSSIFDIPLQFQKLVDNPIDCIISFHCIPVTPSTSGTGSIRLGNLDTEQSAAIINNQYLTIDCGYLSIKEFWGSALDYSPYTKCELYMPFIGIKELKIEDVMNSIIHIKYNIDIFTGDCLCNVKCGQSVLYKFAGNLKQDIPVSGRTNNMGIKGMLGIAGSFAAGAMGAAMGAPPVLAGVAAGISSAASVASSKIVTTRSGSLSGEVGLLDDFIPFLIFHRPVQSLASNFKGHKGYPSNITRQLSSINGYTEVEYINLQNIPNATNAEMDEIKNLLSKGVLF